ncbi:MAG: hypothetical protein ACTSW1_18555 [Candidatus Hodarchaeales archaeon]
MQDKFYRFWLINNEGLYIIDKKLPALKKRVVLTKVEEDNLIANIVNQELPENTIIFTKELVESQTRLYYQKRFNDLYILLTEETVDITTANQEFHKWIKTRQQQRDQLKGIVFTIFDDIEGPKVVFNSCLKEDNALLLAVQGQTVSSMGRIESFRSGFKEPLNVPNREDLQHLSYDFLQPAPSSNDPRIAKMGRVSNIYLIFSKNFPYVKENHFRNFVEAFLDEWVFNWNVMTEDEREDNLPIILSELLEDLRTTVSTAIDMTTHDEREIAKLKVYVMELLTENKVLTSQVRRLRAKIKELEGKNPSNKGIKENE